MKRIKIKLQNVTEKLLRWAFRAELLKLKKQLQKNEIQADRIDNLLNNLDISVDVHYRANSWAVISIQGERSDFIKFIDLGRSDISEIYSFLRRFDRSKVDAVPRVYEWLKFPKQAVRKNRGF